MNDRVNAGQAMASLCSRRPRRYHDFEDILLFRQRKQMRRVCSQQGPAEHARGKGRYQDEAEALHHLVVCGRFVRPTVFFFFFFLILSAQIAERPGTASGPRRGHRAADADAVGGGPGASGGALLCRACNDNDQDQNKAGWTLLGWAGPRSCDISCCPVTLLSKAWAKGSKVGPAVGSTPSGFEFALLGVESWPCCRQLPVARGVG